MIKLSVALLLGLVSANRTHVRQPNFLSSLFSEDSALEIPKGWAEDLLESSLRQAITDT